MPKRTRNKQGGLCNNVVGSKRFILLFILWENLTLFCFCKSENNGTGKILAISGTVRNYDCLNNCVKSGLVLGGNVLHTKKELVEENQHHFIERIKPLYIIERNGKGNHEILKTGQKFNVDNDRLRILRLQLPIVDWELGVKGK